MDIDRAVQFSSKAQRTLRWIDQTIATFESSGSSFDTESVEREFFNLLGLYETLYQSIVDCAKKLELGHLREEINQDRDEDELLNYFRFARNSEVHDAVLKWTPSMRHLEVKVLDPKKVNRVANGRFNVIRLFCYLYNVNNQQELIQAIKVDPTPSKARCANAGVALDMSLDCLALKSFYSGQGKKKKMIKEPEYHMNQPIPPSAWVCVKKARDYYANKLEVVLSIQRQHLNNASI